MWHRGSTGVGRSCKQARPATRKLATSNTSWQPNNCIQTHTHTSTTTKLCAGQMCASSCKVSVVCLSCIYPACCRLRVTACQSCVWASNMCVCSTERQTDRERERGRWAGEGRVIRGNKWKLSPFLSIRLQGDFSTSLSDFLPLVILSPRPCPR